MHQRIIASGVTLPELLATIAVVAILTAAAVPSYQSLIERRRLEGAANALVSDLHFIKSESIKRNKKMYLVFSEGSSWCYGLDDNADNNTATMCDCTDNDPVCEVDSVTRIVSSTDYPAVSIAITAGFSNDRTGFSPLNGLPDPGDDEAGTVRFSTAHSGTRDVDVSAVGRIRMQ